jgi:hypothetical protein
MSDNEITPHPVLKTAWKLYAELDANSTRERDQHYAMRKWVAILGVLATLLAIIVGNYAAMAPYWAEVTLRVLLILAPIVGSLIAAFSNRFRTGFKFLSYRAAAEEVLKEIYLYRTIMQAMPYRYKWLNNRLANIQRRLHKSVSGDMVLKPYAGTVPPYYVPGEAWSDPGFIDLNGEQYFSYRLEEQQAWHIQRSNELQKLRKRLQWAILIMGGMGALFAGMNGFVEGFAVWVALTASITTAFVSWEELRQLDTVVLNYSRVILELTILRDEWLSLETDERTLTAFFKMVQSTEKMLWDQNVEYINAMRESLAEILDEEKNMVEEMIRMSERATEEIQARIRDEFEIAAQTALDESVEMVGEAYSETFDGTWDGDRDPPEVVYEGIEDFSEIIEKEAQAAPGIKSLVATPQAVTDTSLVDDALLIDIVEEDNDDPLRSVIASKVGAAMAEAKKTWQKRTTKAEKPSVKELDEQEDPGKTLIQPRDEEESSLSDDLIA